MTKPDIKIISPKLTDYQKAIVDSKARYTITEAGTKTGKTFSHLWWLFKQAHEYHAEPGNNYWWVAPIYPTAKIAFKRLWRKLAPTGQYKRNQTDMVITTPLETEIHFKTAKDPDNLYGEDVFSAVFDEFTRAKPEAWHALRSTLTHTEAPCKLIGNFKGNSNWGHQLGKKAETDDKYEAFKVTCWDAVDAGILSKEEVEQAQKDLPAFIFSALYLAEGDIDNARLIEDDAIEDLLTNDGVKEDVTRKYLTADIAMQGSDKFVLGAWYGWVLKEIKVIDKSDGKQVVDTIKAMATKHGIRRSHICYDSDGLGQFLDGWLKGSVAFVNGGTPVKVKGKKVQFTNLKSQCYFELSEVINAGNLYFSADVEEWWTEIIEELECVKNRSHGTDGKFAVLKKQEVKEIIGRSPDLTDMMMMRAYFNLRPKGGAKFHFDSIG